uniref:Putative group vi salivary lipocalin n=1 Tax=Rhipicephalus pulchellus TaxID=72859 RepID=L7LT90_RHIPC
MSPTVMSLFSLALIAAVFLSSKAQDPIWNNSKELSEYQMASKVVNRPSDITYYQVASTALITAFIGDNTPQKVNTSCWSARVKNIDGNTKERCRHFHFWKKREVNTANEEVKAITIWNYETENAIEYKYKTDDEDVNVDPVIFTDAASCDLFNVPRENSGKGCELWVEDSYKDKVPSCCSFIFDLLCAMHGSYNVYDNIECKEVVKSWQDDEESNIRRSCSGY